MTATSPDEIATIVVETAKGTFETDLVSVWYVDDDALELQMATPELDRLLR